MGDAMLKSGALPAGEHFDGLSLERNYYMSWRNGRFSMRRLIASLVAASLGLLFGLLLPTGVATAAPPSKLFVHEFRTDINGCNGELIALEGDVRLITHIRAPDGPNVAHITAHSTGVGDQGNQYVFNVDLVSRSNADSLLIARSQIVSLGSAPNQEVILVLDADSGSFSVEAECRG
jgi:hypothetical protein